MRKIAIAIMTGLSLAAGGTIVNIVSENQALTVSAKSSGEYFGWWGEKQDALIKQAAINSGLISFGAGFLACGLTWMVTANAGDRKRNSRYYPGRQFWGNETGNIQDPLEETFNQLRRDKVN